MATTSSDGFEVSKLPADVRKRLIEDYESDMEDPFEFEEGQKVRHLKAVLYGNPGCGKTVLGGRLALPSENILFIDAENSTSVLPSHPEWFKGRVKKTRFKGWLETAYYLDKVVQEGVYTTVVIDSLLSAFRVEMRSIVNGRQSRSSKGTVNPNTDQYEIGEYGIYLNRLSEFVESILRKPLNVIISAHVEEPSDTQIINGQKRNLNGTDKQVKAITGLIDNIFYVELIEGGPGKMDIGIRTRESKDTFARTRINELPTVIPGEDFIRYIHNWLQGKPIKG